MKTKLRSSILLKGLNLSVLTILSTVLLILVTSQTSLASIACNQVFSSPKIALFKAKTRYISLSEGRHIAYQQLVARAGKPTLVLLPGVNRSMPSDYPALKSLAKQGYGLLSLATSSHWESLRGLNENERPFFSQKKDLSSVDFKNEVEALIQKLQIADPVLVSLSYSSSIGAKSALPQIFVAPMVKASDSDPQAAAAAKAWEAGLKMNPFFGDMWVRQFRDGNYHSYWSNVVFGNGGSKAYGGVDASTVIEGYVSISRASEDFNLEKAKFSKQGSNFILGERESEVRLKGQLAAVKRAAAAGPTRVILVRGAEHNVPDTAPEAYATGMTELLNAVTSITALQIGVLNNSKSASVQWLTPAEIKKLLNHVENFGESTAEADLSAVLGEP